MKKAPLIVLGLLMALPVVVWAGKLQEKVGGPDWLQYGADLRLRQEDVQYSPAGALTNTNYILWRIRPRVWLDVLPVKSVDAFVRFTNEYRYYWEPRGYSHPLKKEVILDNGYLGVAKPLDLPVSAKLGRQDLMYGEGFLILDGGPNDGSRTSYSDGGKFTLEMAGTAIDLLAFYNKGTQPFAIDEAKGFRMDDQEIGLYGLYLTNPKLIEKQKIEAYYLYKNGKKSVLKADGTPKFPDNKINIIGARISGDALDNFSYATEWAFQFGDWGEENHRAPGGYLYGTYRVPGCPLKSAVTLGYTYLGGGDPASTTHKNWDPILGRWPKYSDLIFYTVVPEYGVGYWTNMHILKAAWGTQPAENLSVNLILQYLLAEKSFEALNPAFFAGGKTRGFDPQAVVKYKITDWLSSAVIFEYFRPGNFYQDEVQSQYFSRIEFMTTF